MQNPSIELQRKYEAKFILCLVILLHSILQTAPPHHPPSPPKKAQPTTQKAFVLVDGAGDPGGQLFLEIYYLLIVNLGS